MKDKKTSMVLMYAVVTILLAAVSAHAKITSLVPDKEYRPENIIQVENLINSELGNRIKVAFENADFADDFFYAGINPDKMILSLIKDGKSLRLDLNSFLVDGFLIDFKQNYDFDRIRISIVEGSPNMALVDVSGSEIVSITSLDLNAPLIFFGESFAEKEGIYIYEKAVDEKPVLHVSVETEKDVAVRNGVELISGKDSSIKMSTATVLNNGFLQSNRITLMQADESSLYRFNTDSEGKFYSEKFVKAEVLQESQASAGFQKTKMKFSVENSDKPHFDSSRVDTVRRVLGLDIALALKKLYKP
ncbi:MAG: hypothetical protein KKF44_02115 [Nanoarchaeota archaeon]|nr:hypothetical protein [Nanoarchaeota archaeon]